MMQLESVWKNMQKVENEERSFDRKKSQNYILLLTFEINKHLVPVGNFPTIEYFTYSQIIGKKAESV